MKNTILGSLLVSTLILGGFSITVLAADANDNSMSGKTKGDVTFKQGDAPGGPTDPNKPDKPIIPEKPIKPIPTVDGVSLVHAPSFSFGDVKVSPTGDQYPVLESQFYTAANEDGTPDKSTGYFAPDFMQVVDLSGKDTIKWDIKVKHEGFFKAQKDEKTYELKNTSIRLLGQTISNSNNAEGLAGFSLDKEDKGVKYAQIPVADADLTVLSSSNPGATNNSITTNVFKNGYDASVKNDIQKKNNDVLLDVPAGEKPQAGLQYSTDLIWTLTVTP